MPLTIDWCRNRDISCSTSIHVAEWICHRHTRTVCGLVRQLCYFGEPCGERAYHAFVHLQSTIVLSTCRCCPDGLHGLCVKCLVHACLATGAQGLGLMGCCDRTNSHAHSVDTGNPFSGLADTKTTCAMDPGSRSHDCLCGERPARYHAYTSDLLGTDVPSHYARISLS